MGVYIITSHAISAFWGYTEHEVGAELDLGMSYNFKAMKHNAHVTPTPRHAHYYHSILYNGWAVISEYLKNKFSFYFIKTKSCEDNTILINIIQFFETCKKRITSTVKFVMISKYHDSSRADAYALVLIFVTNRRAPHVRTNMSRN